MSAKRIESGDVHESAEGPVTAVGASLRAIALRDDAAFKHWRVEVNKSDAEKILLSPLLIEVFRVAVLRRFPAGVDIRSITAFLRIPKAPVVPGASLPLIEAEALIREARGERGLADDIATAVATVMRLQLFTLLTEDLALSTSALDDLIAEAERTVRPSA